ncbi:MAG: hypothetical protein QOD75_2283 [Blastocatellia bacterium]|jgi:uncharacterized damage-inducible protein DinB|nr:hypothetical protein [Blastocatellia bacterium]
MTELERIQDQMKRAYEGEAWHGPSVRETLADISAKTATSRPLPGAHNIWELVLHIAAWKAAVRRRLEGDRAQLSPEEDWPAVIETDEAAWNSTRDALERAHANLLAAVARLDDSMLHEPILPGMSSRYITLHGVIQHDLYHTGQIGILKKAQTSAENFSN